MERLFKPINVARGIDLAITASTLPYLADLSKLQHVINGNIDGQVALNLGLLLSFIYRRLTKGTIIDTLDKTKLIDGRQVQQEVRRAENSLPDWGKGLLYISRAASWDIVWPMIIAAFSFINQQTHFVPQLIQFAQGLIK